MITLLTPEQVVDSLNDRIPVAAVVAARRSGELAAVKVGRCYYHTPQQVEQWVTSLARPTVGVYAPRSRRTFTVRDTA